MSKIELENILSLINETPESERSKLIEDYYEIVRESYYAISIIERRELISKYSGILFDMGIIKSAHLSDEERAKRKEAAMQRPKFNETEEKIRNIFINIFGEEPYWLKSKKAFAKFHNKGINITPPSYDCNICDNYLCYRPKGYSICRSSGLPYFYIYIGDEKEDIFLYLQKAEETDLASIELNQKAIQFLLDIETNFASRTPDAIYLASTCDNPTSSFMWMETSDSFGILVSSTGRVTSGFSNIVSVNNDAINNIMVSKSYLEEEILNRLVENGNPQTIQRLNETRTLFDEAFKKGKTSKRELINPNKNE